MATPSSVNSFLVEHNITISENPAVSPDAVLDFSGFMQYVEKNRDIISQCASEKLSVEKLSAKLDGLILHTKSRMDAGDITLFLLEASANGDCCLIAFGSASLPFENTVTLAIGCSIIPLYWHNIIHWKNFLQQHDPKSTVFPKAEGMLSHTSIGVGARFTTLHWPAVAWVMSQAGISLTANQNSVPRELVYDVNAMMKDQLSEMPFPFIGGTVPEGHQGQSVQGMSQASVITYAKLGFHHADIPYGFNADHQPIGGRFDEIEDKLVEGSLFASYITYDLSPELSKHSMIEDEKELANAFDSRVDRELFDTITRRIKELQLQIDDTQLRRLVTYLAPAMDKMKIRDRKYSAIRQQYFTTDTGQRYFRELSIDELPGQTTPQVLGVSLAFAEALGVDFQFVAPNLGFQKNFPYEDNDELRSNTSALYAVAEKFGVSLGIHSGSGKSAENYRILSECTHGNLEIKTSGRYTYEMGNALSTSRDPGDRALWSDWYAFCKELALQGAFSSHPQQKKFAREFIERSFPKNAHPDFSSPQSLRNSLDVIAPSPDHMLWFEYNFLYVLAAQGSGARLGDHGPEGYAQRRRFYDISDEGKLLFAQHVASYILFIAKNTGIVDREKADELLQKLENYTSLDALHLDING